jgi:bifunctional non-homologous end joining protein LigD
MSNTQIDRYEIELKHLDKVFFPDAGITKGDCVAYYRKVADVMLTHREARPLSSAAQSAPCRVRKPIVFCQWDASPVSVAGAVESSPTRSG